MHAGSLACVWDKSQPWIRRVNLIQRRNTSFWDTFALESSCIVVWNYVLAFLRVVGIHAQLCFRIVGFSWCCAARRRRRGQCPLISWWCWCWRGGTRCSLWLDDTQKISYSGSYPCSITKERWNNYSVKQLRACSAMYTNITFREIMVKSRYCHSILLIVYDRDI